jgi:hypothetical protein
MTWLSASYRPSSWDGIGGILLLRFYFKLGSQKTLSKIHGMLTRVEEEAVVKHITYSQATPSLKLNKWWTICLLKLYMQKCINSWSIPRTPGLGPKGYQTMVNMLYMNSQSSVVIILFIFIIFYLIVWTMFTQYVFEDLVEFRRSLGKQHLPMFLSSICIKRTKYWIYAGRTIFTCCCFLPTWHACSNPWMLPFLT